MLDRIVGLIGLALGLVSFVAPYRWPNMPPLITTVGLYLAIALVGAAAGMYYNQNYGQNTEVAPGEVSMFLQFSDDHTVPTEIRQTNILSWYALYTESIYVDMQNEQKKTVGRLAVPPRWTIFLLFKYPITYRQMLAKCVGPESLHCAVQFSNDKYAIITAIGEVTNATLEISTTK